MRFFRSGGVSHSQQKIRTFAERTIAFFRSAYNAGYFLLQSSGGNRPVVNVNTAFALATYYRGVKFIADRMVEVPFSIVRPDGEGEVIAKNHYMQRLIRDGVGPWYDRTSLVRVTTAHLLTRGNHYSIVEYNNRGQVEELKFANPWTTVPRVQNGQLVYDIVANVEGGLQKTYPASKIFHVKGLTLDGINGMDPITTCMTSLGLAISSNEYGANFFANDARPSTVLHTDDNTIFTDKQKKQIKERWQKDNSGSNNRGTVLLAGVTHVSQLDVNPNDSQFLETRQEAVRDIARMLGIPPVLLGDPAASTYDNISQLYRAFVTDTLIPIATQQTAAIDKQLVFQPYYSRFDFKSALVDSIKDRYVAYSIATGKKPFVSINEVRAMEDKPPTEGGDEIVPPVEEGASSNEGQQGFGEDVNDDSSDNVVQNADI